MPGDTRLEPDGGLSRQPQRWAFAMGSVSAAGHARRQSARRDAASLPADRGLPEGRLSRQYDVAPMEADSALRRYRSAGALSFDPGRQSDRRSRLRRERVSERLFPDQLDRAVF